ncbi:RNA polymerase I-specific transcription initiation factor RRN7 [Entomortierella parvispora]|uniref:RNA polymerase I-specific transcription initiation factor RRN7 n=1 Tax=Entomortierella parvispora TaxID=205924 RepID=A0A9P3LT75_9FUNG|nr:RNA polymerase I-specific transcription initiation factor RRN7 [Entomortierella parvispora]
MGKKPPCRICRSRRWRKNSNGFFICELGHQLEGHQEEVSEFDATMGSTYQRVKKGPKRKRKVQENLISFLSGRDLDFYFLQCIQLLLRKQLYAMIHELGCPAEIENVAHEYWTLYMASLTAYRASNDTLNTDDDDESDDEGEDNSEQDGKNKDKDKDMETGPESEKQLKKSKKSSDPVFKDKADVSEEEPDDLDNMDEYQRSDSSSSESEDEGNDDENDNDDDDNLNTGLPQKKTRKTLPSGKVVPSKKFLKNSATDLTMPSTIAICFLSAQHLKLPIVMGDFYRWTMDRTIPYFNAENYFPPEMRGRALVEVLAPKHRGIEVFQNAAGFISNHMLSEFGVVPRTPNIPPMIFRFVQELMLPVEVYPCAMRLYHIFQDKTSEKLGRHYRHQTTMNPVIAMAVVLVIAKLIYGLDDKKRSTPQPSSWLNSLPRESDIFKSLDVFDSLQAQTKIPTLFGEFEELIKLNPDLYTEYCENELKPYPRLGWATRPRGLLPLLSVFESTNYGDLTTGKYEERPTPTIEAFIQHLHSKVPTPKDREDWTKTAGPPPLKPGEGYVHYNSDATGEYLGQYKRMLSYATNILCVTTDQLQEAVGRVELYTVCDTVHSAGKLNIIQKRPPPKKTTRKALEQALGIADDADLAAVLLENGTEAAEGIVEDIPEDFDAMDFEDF